jgi:plastocyanin
MLAMELLRRMTTGMSPRLAGQTLVLAAAALAVLAAGPPIPATVAVHGTARAGTHPAADTVVWLEAPNAPAAIDRRRVVLDQRNLDFSPHVLAVRVGTTVDFPNDDRVFHNVFSFRDGKVFDLGMYPVGALKHVTFDRPGLSRIFCNIHPNMAAYVMAVETPYFAVADRAGAFTIAGVPAGRYRFQAWKPGGATLTGTWEANPLNIDWP